MAQPVWVTPAGDLGTIAENLFFQRPIEAVDPDGGTLTYTLIAGRLPEGVQVTSNGLIEGVPQAFVTLRGTPTEVSENVTSTFAIRAISPDGLSINDRTFSLTVTGQDAPTFTTPAGSLGTFFDCDNVNITIGFTDSDPNDTVTIEVDNGELPPGLTLNATTGLISGHISPISNLPNDATSGFDASAFDLYPFDFPSRSINKNYEFTLRISDGKDQNLRTFTMYVVSRDSLTADTDDFTADTDILTADLSPLSTPYITNYPAAIVGPPAVAAGTIGTFRHDNFFAYQIKGFDCDNDPIEFSIVTGDSSDLPPGITFNTLTGWLSGYFPDQGATEQTFNFSIIIAKANRPEVQSEPYDYNITVIGNIENAVTWLTGTFVPGTELAPVYSLGTIDNGAVSRLAVKASNPSGRTLQFKLKAGSYPNTPGQYNLLPQGLELLSSGNISGRVSFNTFAIDSGTTTFDKEVSTRLISGETTFDKAFDFTVVAYSSDGLVSVSRTFRITVDREYNSPYNGIYIKAMPDQNDRTFIRSLIQNTDIIPPSRVYRADDAYFGVARNVIYNHAYSLDTATLEQYVNALTQNHFQKKLILGEIKTAQALNADGTVEYEVVYSDVIDTGVNKLGQSPPQSIKWPVELTVDGVDHPDRLSNETITAKVGLANQGVDYLEPALNANLLATVASQMSKDWAAAGSPGDPAGDDPSGTFTWSPSNECDTYSDNVRYDLFKTQLEAAALANNIIYSEYYTGKEENGNVQRYIEPFAFLVEQGDHAYIVIRGTLGEGNVKLDVDAANKVDNPLGQGQIGSGWLKAFQGLGVPSSASAPGYTRGSDVPGITLQQALENTTKTKLRICSHSLGSAMATLVCAYAVSLNKFEIEGLPSASPRVGNLKFRTWFDNLTDINGNKMVDRWKRLTNINDTIPTVPYIAMGFVHVGLEINFDALYLNDKGKKDTGLNHQICCCYGYALKNPTDPLNPENNGIACIFPKPRASGDLDINAHYEQLLTFYDQFLTPLDELAVTTQTVYPNSLINMRDRVVDTIGQTNTILPLWMTSKQTNGRVLGFTRAWVIAYTKPGESDRISYNIRTQFGEILNRVDFISDRYILDNQLTANWVPNEDSTDGGNWNPSPPLSTTFDTDFDISGLYVSTSLVADATNSAVFDRSLTVNGILVVAAGAVGGQLAVPDEWVKKVGRSYQLIMDPDATGIDSSAQKQMIRTLKGLTGTWHAGFQTAQRVGYNGGSSYSPNWLTDIGAASYAGYEDFLAQHAVNDMVWYKNSNGWNGTGIKDVEEVFEHIMHTIHLYGVRGGVQGSVTELNWDSENNPGTYTGTELFKAMEQAIDNGMYDAGALDPYDSTEAHLLMKEYMYLLNWGMWEMSVFWAGGSLAPEWNDLMRTPAGILANNPLGYALFNTYFAPVLSKPNFATLNSIFQDNDQGLSGYITTSAVNSATTFDGNSLRFTSPVDVYGKTDSYDKYLVFPKKNILGT